MIRMDMTAMAEIEGGLHLSAVLKNAPEFSDCVLSAVDEEAICPVHALLELWGRVREHSPQATGLFLTDNYLDPMNKYRLELDMRQTMHDANVPVQFTPYSIKHAAITYLIGDGVPESIINKNARMSLQAGTAIKHYLVGEACRKVAAVIASAQPRQRIESRFLLHAHLTALPVGGVLSLDSPSPEDLLWLSTGEAFHPEDTDLEDRDVVSSSADDETDVDPVLFSRVCSFLSFSDGEGGSNALVPSGTQEG
jgi:hypothetical protein